MRAVAGVRIALSSILYFSLIFAVTVPFPRSAAAIDASPHEGIACAQCHGSEGSAFARAQAGGDASAACRGCHDVQSAIVIREMQGFHRDPARPCTDCHSFHEPARLKVGERTFLHAFGDERIGAHCAACHRADTGLSGLTEGHAVAAAAFYHAGGAALRRMTPSEACLACHSLGGSAVAAGFAGTEAPRFNEHASHPYGVTVRLGAGDRFNHIRTRLDPRIRLFDGKIECRTCHDLSSDEDDRLVRFETKYELCRGCHVHEASRPEAMLAEMR